MTYTLATLGPLLGEAVRAVHGLVTAGLERDPSNATAFRADCFVHVPSTGATPGSRTIPWGVLLPLRAAGFAPLRLVLKLHPHVILLVIHGEREFTAALHAHYRPVNKVRHCQFPFCFQDP